MKKASAPSFLLAPSLLAADFSNLTREIGEVEAEGADWIHLDVMDGHFVPNLTMGPALVKSIRPKTQLPLDCHLMVTDPAQWIEPFARSGVNLMTVHIEACADPTEILKAIRTLGCKAGLSLNPQTPVSVVEPFLGSIDLVLVMSVHPGFSYQAFDASCLPKIRQLSAAKKSKKLDFLIEVDGGIQVSNISKVCQAGADVIVAGGAIFGSSSRRKAIQDLKQAAECPVSTTKDTEDES